MFPCITPVSAHFWPPLEKGPFDLHMYMCTYYDMGVGE